MSQSVFATCGSLSPDFRQGGLDPGQRAAAVEKPRYETALSPIPPHPPELLAIVDPWRPWFCCFSTRLGVDSSQIIALQPTEDRPTLQDRIRDCAETSSPVGQPANTSTYWIDRMSANIEHGHSKVAHRNLWVLTLRDNVLELRMDVDPPDSDPLDTVPVSEMHSGLEMLRNEIATRVADGHQLDDRTWIQRNP